MDVKSDDSNDSNNSDNDYDLMVAFYLLLTRGPYIHTYSSVILHFRSGFNVAFTWH